MKVFAIMLLMTLPFVAACQKQGPLERAGKAVDSAVQDTKKSGEAAGKKVDDAVDDVSDGVKDAADDLKKN
jgi:predicted small lipoprotein YifL